MRKPFPPGASSSLQSKRRSLWREFEFVMHQIQSAIEPYIGLERAINCWDKIQQMLSEPPRKRESQIANILEYYDASE